MTGSNISGIHHITAISASAVENLAFYENTLGLRLVKQTVNFDDPSTYHLYYGDEQGTPGTILTFFPWEKLPQGRSGSGMVTAIAFAVPMTMDSMDFWKRRMAAAGIRIETCERFGESVIRFVDPHGLPLELIGISHPPDTLFRQAGTIPKAHAITGFHSATATLNDLESITALLRDVMGMTLSGQEKHRYRFNMDNPETPGHYYDLIVDPQARSGRPGSGTVHHVAFRTENDATQVQWQSILRGSGFEVTDVRDRQYFRSIYFRSPGGVLFEMATDSPGFSVDEAAADLGTSLKLPPQYERSRAAIEKQLPALRVGASRTKELHFLTATAGQRGCL
jgi:glyoxalase family protein